MEIWLLFQEHLNISDCSSLLWGLQKRILPFPPWKHTSGCQDSGSRATPCSRRGLESHFCFLWYLAVTLPVSAAANSVPLGYLLQGKNPPAEWRGGHLAVQGTRDGELRVSLFCLQVIDSLPLFSAPHLTLARPVPPVQIAFHHPNRCCHPLT